MILFLLFVPVIALVYFAYIDGSVKLFDLTSNIIMYLGTIISAIAIYYFSWIQSINQDRFKRIAINVETIPNYDRGSFIFYKEDEIIKDFEYKEALISGKNFEYVKLELSNMNNHSPLYVEYVGSYYYFNNKPKDVSLSSECFLTNLKSTEYLIFDKPKTFYLGMDSSIFNELLLDKEGCYHYYFVFLLRNPEGHSAYLVYHDYLSKGCSNSSFFVLTYGKYKYLTKKYGFDILRDVGYGDLLNKYK